MTAFLGCDVQIAPAVALKEVSRGLREGAEGQDQIDAKEAMAHLTKMTKPRHVMCTVGVTMIDLYPYADWNFVFGLANPLVSDGSVLHVPWCRAGPLAGWFTLGSLFVLVVALLTCVHTIAVLAAVAHRMQLASSPLLGTMRLAGT